jgi:pyocin large subunit-like protein
MSYQAVKWALDVRTGSTARKAVLLVIAEHADQHGRNAYPDQEKIARQTEQSVDSVQRHLRALVQGGILTRERRFEPKTGHRMSDVYAIDLNRETCGVGQDRKVCGHQRKTLSPMMMRSRDGGDSTRAK